MTTVAECIDRRLSELPPSRAARLEHLLMGLLEFVEPELRSEAVEVDDKTRRQRALAALNRIAARGGIAAVEDPMAWQREQRIDRELPGRGS